MDAALGTQRHTAFCLASREDCMAGNGSAHCRKSFWWRAYSTWLPLWQAGFRNVICALGNHLNAPQLWQLCDGATRTVQVVFDADSNGSGQQAARRLSSYLSQRQV